MPNETGHDRPVIAKWVHFEPSWWGRIEPPGSPARASPHLEQIRGSVSGIVGLHLVTAVTRNCPETAM